MPGVPSSRVGCVPNVLLRWHMTTTASNSTTIEPKRVADEARDQQENKMFFFLHFDGHGGARVRGCGACRMNRAADRAAKGSSPQPQRWRQQELLHPNSDETPRELDLTSHKGSHALCLYSKGDSAASGARERRQSRDSIVRAETSDYRRSCPRPARDAVGRPLLQEGRFGTDTTSSHHQRAQHPAERAAASSSRRTENGAHQARRR